MSFCTEREQKRRNSAPGATVGVQGSAHAAIGKPAFPEHKYAIHY